MRKQLVLAVTMLAIVAVYTLPVIAQPDATTIMAQAEDKAKNKDIVKEKGKKGKDKGKKGKGKDEERDLPTSGGISGGYAAIFALGAGALIFGVLLVRGRRRAPNEGRGDGGGSPGDGD